MASILITCLILLYQIKFSLSSMLKTIECRLVPDEVGSDPDLYISKTSREVTRENSIWKQMSIGTIQWELQPLDLNYSSGWYYIGIYGSKEGYNPFTLTITLSDPSIFFSKK